MPVINLLADFCLCMTFALAFSISIRLARVIVSSIEVGTGKEVKVGTGKETSEKYILSTKRYIEDYNEYEDI